MMPCNRLYLDPIAAPMVQETKKYYFRPSKVVTREHEGE